MKKALISILLILLLCTACSAPSSISTTQQSDSSASEQAEKKTFAIGEECFVKNDNGEYKITITGIKETDDRNEFSDIEAERVVIVSYTYENISCADDLYVSDMNFKLYDADGNILESYPVVDVTYPDSIGQGRKCSADAAYALNNPQNHIELELYGNMFSSTADCMFLLEW